MFRPVWIEINLKNLVENYMYIKKKVGPKTKIIAVLKQNAYGHGLIAVAKKLSSLNVDFLGVGSIEEGIELRKAGIKERVLIITVVDKRYIPYLIRYRLTPTVVDYTFCQYLNKQIQMSKKKFPIHVKVDTGMGRLGPWYRDSFNFIKYIDKKMDKLFIEGIFTHLPCADIDREFTLKQIREFKNFLNALRTEGINFRYSHISNSAALFNYPEAYFDMVRPGLALYGISPLPKPDIDTHLKPVLSLKAKIIFVKSVPAGRSISYARTYTTSFPTNIVTVPIGYADGYPWNLSNRSKVIIKNMIYPVVGRVCMDHIMVDVGNSKVKVGDTVILIGKTKNYRISVEDLADWADTIPYEIVTRFSYKLPRIYIKQQIFTASI